MQHNDLVKKRNVQVKSEGETATEHYVQKMTVV